MAHPVHPCPSMLTIPSRGIPVSPPTGAPKPLAMEGRSRGELAHLPPFPIPYTNTGNKM
jgi:hypothetical protein